MKTLQRLTLTFFNMAVIIAVLSGCGLATPTPAYTATPTAENLPPATPNSTPVVISTPAPLQPIGALQRINFATGGTSASVQGTANPIESLAYMVNAGRNQIMTITLTSSGRLGLGISGSGGPLQDSAEGKTSWSGMLPRTSDYLITVQSMDGEPSTFTMQVNIPLGPTPTAFAEKLCNVPAPNPLIPDSASWAPYCNTAYGFGFRHPPARVTLGEDYALFQLPVVAGTTLDGKYLDVMVEEGITDCSPTLVSQDHGAGELRLKGTVSFNGVSFKEETRVGVAAGTTYESVTYSTAHGSICVGLTFLLSWNKYAKYTTPPVEFDKAAESTVFEQIMATFSWLES